MADPGSEEHLFRDLDRYFDRAIERAVQGPGPPSLLFSGGVDSTLVALAMRRYGAFDAQVLGTPGSADPRRAESAAAQIGIHVHEVRVDDRAVEHLLREEGTTLEGLAEPARSVQVALALIVGACPGAVVLAGQGADELFGGYAHFRGLAPAELTARRQQDLDRLVGTDWPLSRALAGRRGRDLRSPFLDGDFATFAGAIPLEPMAASALTKPRLRRWAMHRGVPEEIARRPKTAMQYGSGVAAAVRRVVRTHRS